MPQAGADDAFVQAGLAGVDLVMVVEGLELGPLRQRIGVCQLLPWAGGRARGLYIAPHDIEHDGMGVVRPPGAQLLVPVQT